MEPTRNELRDMAARLLKAGKSEEQVRAEFEPYGILVAAQAPELIAEAREAVEWDELLDALQRRESKAAIISKLIERGYSENEARKRLADAKALRRQRRENGQLMAEAFDAARARAERSDWIWGSFYLVTGLSATILTLSSRSSAFGIIAIGPVIYGVTRLVRAYRQQS